MPTIAAVATPPGSGGIAVIRMSGPGAKPLLARIFLPHSPAFVNFRPWTMHRGAILDAEDEPLDDVLAVFMPGPHTYTGEDVAEIHSHGGQTITNAIMDSLLRLGARLAEPGEFTRRAYLNGRMDLTQAEAVAEMIAAPSREAVRNSFNRLEGRLGLAVQALANEIDELRALVKVAVDFPEDEVESLGREDFLSRARQLAESISRLLKNSARASLMANGAVVALVGAVNAGKSSLFNALAGSSRAIVTDIPGTTRDYLECRLSFDGLPITLVDTAGMHDLAVDQVEKLGIEKTWQIVEDADLVCAVVDGQQMSDSKNLDKALEILERREGGKGLLVWNKADLAPLPDNLARGLASWPVCAVSALTGENIDGLANIVRALLLDDSREAPREDFPPPNARQTHILKRALEEIKFAQAEIIGDVPYDCILSRLDETFALLGQIIALAPDDELLDRIFSRFCIGK